MARMTDKQFLECCRKADSYTDKDSYVSDMDSSSIWWDIPENDIPDDRIRAIGDIWDACHRSVKEIAEEAGLSQRKLAERFCIPYRTMESWGGEQRSCNLYVRLMMQEILGLIKR